jgi:hypothetical protein
MRDLALISFISPCLAKKIISRRIGFACNSAASITRRYSHGSYRHGHESDAAASLLIGVPLIQPRQLSPWTGAAMSVPPPRRELRV